MPQSGITGVRLSHGDGFSIKAGVKSIRELLQSQQFWNWVKLAAFGAVGGGLLAVSRGITELAYTAVRRLFLARCVFRSRDDAYKWLVLYLTQHPDIKMRPRDVEVSTKQVPDGDDATLYSSGEAGIFFFPAENQIMHFKFGGYHVWASRSRGLVGDTEWEETFSLSFLAFSSAPLREFVAHIREKYQEHQQGRCIVNTLDRYGRWGQSRSMAKRPAHSLHLPDGSKERLLEDAKHFLSPQTRRWYQDHGVPYRRGWLLSGIPGSGKTSLVHVVASELELPIYTISLCSKSLDDAAFNEIMQEIPARSVVLLEDIDAAFVQRNQGSDSKGGVSFSTLLNAIDGVGAAEARLLCLTTNHRELLDEALIRPGRIDMEVTFKHANADQARELFERWFTDYTPRAAAALDTSFSASEKPPLQLASSKELAEVFAQRVPASTFSVAELQGWLLSCGNSMQAAVDGVEGWAQERLRQRKE